MNTDCSWNKEPDFATICEVNHKDPTSCPLFGNECKDCDWIYDLSEMSELKQRIAHNELVDSGTDEGDTYYVRDIEWERKLP